MSDERSAAFDRIDRFLRGNLDDTEYAPYAEALDVLWSPTPARGSAVWVVRDALDEAHAAFPTEKAAVNYTHGWVGDGLLSVTRETLLTPPQAAVIAAAKVYVFSNVFTSELFQPLKEAVTTLRAQEGGMSYVDAAIARLQDEAERKGTTPPTPDAGEPFWLGALRMAAQNELMADTQCVPIVNDGTYRAVYDHIASLTAQLAAANRERDAYRKAKQENDERFMIERDTARSECEKLRSERAKRDEAIVGYGRSVILTAYANHVNEYRLTRPEYAETLMREVLVNVDRYMERDAARTGAR